MKKLFWIFVFLLVILAWTTYKTPEQKFRDMMDETSLIIDRMNARADSTIKILDRMNERLDRQVDSLKQN